MVWLFVPTSTKLVSPTGATPTGTLAWLSEPDPSAVRVTAGVPVVRPQYTSTFSLGPNPAAETVTVSPGLPADLPTMDTLPTPWGVTSGAEATPPPAWTAITVALGPVRDLGMVKAVVSTPPAVVLPCATTVPEL